MKPRRACTVALYISSAMLIGQACGASPPEVLAPNPDPSGSVAHEPPTSEPGQGPWAGLSLQTIGEARRASEPSDVFFASTTDEKVLRVGREESGWWDGSTLRPINGLHVGVGLHIAKVIASGDLSMLIALRYEDDAQYADIWNLAAGERVGSERLSRETQRFAAGRAHVAVYDESGRIAVFDAQGQRVWSKRAPAGCSAVALSANGQTAALWKTYPSSQITLHFPSAPTKQLEGIAIPDGTDAFALDLNDDGSQLAMGTFGAVRVVEVANERTLIDERLDDAYIDVVSLSPEGALFVPAGMDSVAVFANGTRRDLPRVFRDFNVERVVWRGERIIATGRNTYVAWDRGEPVFGLERSLPYGVVEVRPLEAPLVEVLSYRSRQVYNAQTGGLHDSATLDPFAHHRFHLRHVDVELNDALLEASEREDAYVLDANSDGSRRIVQPRRARARLVGAEGVEAIAPATELPGRRFSAGGGWYIGTSSYDDNRYRDLVLRRSRDGEELARAELTPQANHGGELSIRRHHVLRDDRILVQNAIGVRLFRFDAGVLANIAQHDFAGVENWALAEAEMLLAIPGESTTLVQRLGLPGLELIGEMEVPGSRDPSLTYLPDGRRFAIVVDRQLQFHELPQ